MVGEGPGQQPALETRKVIRSSHTSFPPTHTPPHTQSLISQTEKASQAQAEGDGRPGPGGAKAFDQRPQAAG